MRFIQYQILVVLLVWGREADSQHTLYPLSVGTQWAWSPYHVMPSEIQEITQDTLMPNGHRYAVIPSLQFMPLGDRIERQKGDSVYRYRSFDGGEDLWFDFSRLAGDTVNHSPVITRVENLNIAVKIKHHLLLHL